MCKRNPHQLFMRLVSLAQKFVVEVKVRLLALLHDLSVNNFAEIFFTGTKIIYLKLNDLFLPFNRNVTSIHFFIGLLDDYDALITTAVKISEFVKLLKDHLGKFNYKFPLPWAAFIKKLYQIYIYDDPLIKNNLPPFIDQVNINIYRVNILIQLQYPIDTKIHILEAFTVKKTFAFKRLGISTSRTSVFMV